MMRRREGGRERKRYRLSAEQGKAFLDGRRRPKHIIMDKLLLIKDANQRITGVTLF